MRVNPEQYPYLLIMALVGFTILGLALGFRPSHQSGEHNLTPVITKQI
jgi:hypothetical protein